MKLLATRLAPLALALGLAGCVTNPSTPSGSGALGSALSGLAAGSTSGGLASALTGGGGASTSRAGGGNLLELLAQSVESIDEAKEIEIGRQLSAILLGSKPLSTDAALQRYVNNLGRWISLQSSRPDLPWTFMVLNDGGFNAFAAPGGYVFVTKGLVDAARGEAELGGVLAHEITHVVEKHHLKSLNKTAQAALAGQVLAASMKNGLAQAVTSQLVSMGKELYAKGLDRDDEFEADRKGVALATRAGLDPFGLPSLLQTLAQAQPGNPNYVLALATHPPTAQRLAALESSMGNRLDGFAAARPVLIAQRVSGAKASAPAPAAPSAPAKASPVKKPPAAK